MGYVPKYENFKDGPKREQDLRLAEKIVNSDMSDLQKAVELRRIFKDSRYFSSRYFFLLKEQNTYYVSKEDIIMKIFNTIMEFEENGTYDKAKEEDKYRVVNYTIDAREVITDYINDSESYKTGYFFNKHGIKYDVFRTCESNIKRNNPDLYDKYLIAKHENDNKELLIPIMRLSEIRESIKSGTTSDGRPFDIYEFWKLNPFITEDLFMDLKKLGKKHEEVKKISTYFQKYNDGGHRPLTYRDFLCSFVDMLSFDTDGTIKNYMEENNIKSCVLFNRDNVNNNFSVYQYEDITLDEVNGLIDYMEDEKIPFVKDALVKLEKDYVKQKSYSKENRKQLRLQLVKEEE